MLPGKKLFAFPTVSNFIFGQCRPVQSWGRMQATRSDQVFRKFAEPPPEGDDFDKCGLQTPISDIFEHLKLPSEHVRMFEQVLKKETDFKRKPEMLSFQLFRRVLIKVLRRIRDLYCVRVKRGGPVSVAAKHMQVLLPTVEDNWWCFLRLLPDGPHQNAWLVSCFQRGSAYRVPSVSLMGSCVLWTYFGQKFTSQVSS